MTAILLRASAYIFMIFLGYTLKRVGFFAPGDFRIISNIVMNITLPAAVITSFANAETDLTLVVAVLLGLGCNLVLISIAWLLSRKRSDSTRALYMINIPGYNIGTFTMPFAQNFLGPLGVASLSLFDTGNALMVTGGSFAFLSKAQKSGTTVRIKDIILILRNSIPFLTYSSMLILVLLQIRIPAFVTIYTAPIGAANSFMAMLMVGMMFEIRLDPKSLKKAALVLLVRYLGSAGLAWLFFTFLPFPLVFRQALVIGSFAPISSLAPMFTERGQGDGALASLVNSLSIVISMVLITGLILALGIGQA